MVFSRLWIKKKVTKKRKIIDCPQPRKFKKKWRRKGYN